MSILQALKPCLSMHCNLLTINAGLGWLALGYRDETFFRLRGAGDLDRFRRSLGMMLAKPASAVWMDLAPGLVAMTHETVAGTALSFETAATRRSFAYNKDLAATLDDLHQWLRIQGASGNIREAALTATAGGWQLTLGHDTIVIPLADPPRLAARCLAIAEGRGAPAEPSEVSLVPEPGRVWLCFNQQMVPLTRTELVILASRILEAGSRTASHQ